MPEADSFYRSKAGHQVALEAKYSAAIFADKLESPQFGYMVKWANQVAEKSRRIEVRCQYDTGLPTLLDAKRDKSPWSRFQKIMKSPKHAQDRFQIFFGKRAFSYAEFVKLHDKFTELKAGLPNMPADEFNRKYGNIQALRHELSKGGA